MDSPSPRRYHNLNSPNSSTSSTNSNGGLSLSHQQPPVPTTPTSSSMGGQVPPPPPPPPLFPAPRNNNSNLVRSQSYPTTFVQADTNSFKQVVQMLTGCNETARLASSKAYHGHIPPMKTIPNKKPHQSSGYKLYERRNNALNLNPLLPAAPNNNNVNVVGFGVGSPHQFPSPRYYHPQEVLSPSILDLPSLVLSPVTPLLADPFGRSSTAGPTLDSEAEDRAIKEKGFYLHPSPPNASTPRDTHPRLLPLFPTASPKPKPSPPSA